VLPQEVILTWPKMKARMSLKFDNMQVVKIDPTRAAHLFQRSNLAGIKSFDLARRMVDSPGPERASYPPR
jgi:hypothetical protein